MGIWPRKRGAGHADADRAKRARGRRARRLGRRGERRAARALRRSGYRILARNWRTPAGEIDLLAREGGRWVVVEVKSRSAGAGRPLEARFDHAKRERLRRIGRYLRRMRALGGAPLRYDLVLVTFDGCRSVVTIRRDLLNG